MQGFGKQLGGKQEVNEMCHQQGAMDDGDEQRSDKDCLAKDKKRI